MDSFSWKSGVIMIGAILVACSSLHTDWESTKRQNTVHSYSTFLAHHPKSEYDDEARAKIAELGEKEFQKTQTKNTLKDYESFLQSFPNHNRSAEVAGRVDELQWANATKSNSIKGYLEYLNKQPNGKHRDQGTSKLEAIRSESLNSPLWSQGKSPPGCEWKCIQQECSRDVVQHFLEMTEDAIRSTKKERQGAGANVMNQKSSLAPAGLFSYSCVSGRNSREIWARCGMGALGMMEMYLVHTVYLQDPTRVEFITNAPIDPKIVGTGRWARQCK